MNRPVENFVKKSFDLLNKANQEYKKFEKDPVGYTWNAVTGFLRRL